MSIITIDATMGNHFDYKITVKERPGATLFSKRSTSLICSFSLVAPGSLTLTQGYEDFV